MRRTTGKSLAALLLAGTLLLLFVGCGLFEEEGENPTYSLLAMPLIVSVDATDITITVQVSSNVGWVGAGGAFSPTDYCLAGEPEFINNGNGSFTRTCALAVSPGIYHFAFRLSSADADTAPYANDLTSWDNDMTTVNGLYGYSNWDHTGGGSYFLVEGTSDVGPADLDHTFP